MSSSRAALRVVTRSEAAFSCLGGGSSSEASQLALERAMLGDHASFSQRAQTVDSLNNVGRTLVSSRGLTSIEMSVDAGVAPVRIGDRVEFPARSCSGIVVGYSKTTVHAAMLSDGSVVPVEGDDAVFSNRQVVLPPVFKRAARETDPRGGNRILRDGREPGFSQAHFAHDLFRSASVGFGMDDASSQQKALLQLAGRRQSYIGRYVVRINMLSAVWERNSLTGCLCLGRGGCEEMSMSWKRGRQERVPFPRKLLPTFIRTT